MSLLPADPSSNPPDYPLPMAAPGRLVMRPGGGMPARMGATAPAAEGGPSFGVLLKGLRRHLGLALVLGLFCAGLTAIVTWYVLPLPKYTATALLQVHSREQHIVKGVDGEGYSQARFKLYQQTQEKIITSNFVLAAALRDPKIARLPSVRIQVDPVDWLARNIKIEFIGEVLTISLGGNNPDEIAKLVNAVTEAYIREVVNVEHNGRLDRYARLKDAFNDYMEKLKEKRRKLEDLSLAAGSNNKMTLAVKHQMQLTHHQDVRHELSRVANERHKAEMDLELAVQRAQAPRAPITRADVAPAIAADPSVMTLTNDLKKQNEIYQDYKRRVKNAMDPALRKMRDRLAEKQKTLKEVTDQVAGDLIKQRLAEQEAETGVDSIEDLKKSIVLLRQWEDDLQKTVDKLSNEANVLNKTTLELDTLQDEIAHIQATSETVGEQTEQLSVELQAPKRVKLLHLADAPKVMNLTKHLAVTGFVGLSSLGLVLFGIAFWETRIQRVDTADEVVRGLGVGLVGVLPALPTSSRGLPARRSSRELQEKIWNNILLESVDATRAMVLHASRTEPLQVLMVASALKGEGKTSLACHLATSLARARRRTLLVDCDLRSPAVHRMFDVLSQPGICEVLRGEAPLAEAVQPTVAAGLSVLPAGRCDSQALQALAHGRLETILEELKPQYDYIIVDTAPVLPVADTLQISQHVDAVLFSVLRDVSRLPKVYAAYERLALLGVRMLGAVVAGARCEHYASSYAYNMPQPSSDA
jgi:capsular exopolysaccharide synthesis family protein